MDRDGGNPHALTETAGDNIDPSWSPDGSQIAFVSSRSGSPQLWVMNSDGSNAHKITPDLAEMGGRNSWSPDGKRIAFYAGKGGDRNIYTIAADSSQVQQITQGGDNLGPSWSPDGQWIAFTSFRDGNNEIYAIHPDGSTPTRLTTDPRPDWQPRWGK
jgi:Tol biopolymer transport system component